MDLSITLAELYPNELELMISDDLVSNTMRWDTEVTFILGIDFAEYLRLLVERKRHYQELLQLDKQLN